MNIKEARKQYWNDVNKAAKEYNSRKNRKSDPSGKFDNSGRWYPDDNETCNCCNEVRSPSRAHPYSLMTH